MYPFLSEEDHLKLLTWNNDISIAQNGELNPTQVLSPGCKPRNSHHNRQLKTK